MKAWCAKCNRSMEPIKTGATYIQIEVVELGVDRFSLYEADVYRCCGCGQKILTGFALMPYKVYNLSEGFLRKIVEIYNEDSQGFYVEGYNNALEFIGNTALNLYDKEKL